MKFKLRREIEIEAPSIEDLTEVIADGWKIVQIIKGKNGKNVVNNKKM